MLTKPQRDKLYKLAQDWLKAEHHADDEVYFEMAFVEYLNSLVPAPLPGDKAKETQS